MNKFIVALLLILTSITSYAQNRGRIKGKVLDSLHLSPLEKVTIAITDLKDSSFVAYTATSKSGEFMLTGIPSAKPLMIIGTMIGYTAFAKKISLKEGQVLDLGTINMNPGNDLLEEVMVYGQRQAVVVNKDTIEFNVESFKVRPNAVVEELLKRLPGVQIDNNGKITVNGKEVSKITIDGKTFFGNDPRIASQNLDADLLDKVQIFDDRENDPDHLLDESRVNKIINLKFKKAFKKSVFGKVYGGVGDNDRYESGGLINMFRDTLQISLIGVGNNLNKTGFSNHDLSEMGGFNRSGEDALYNGSIPVGGGGYGGIENILSGGININNDYGTRLKMNLIYFYNKTITDLYQKTSGLQFLETDTLFVTSDLRNRMDNRRHNVTGLLEWKPDSLNSIRYAPKFSISDETNLGDQHTSNSNKLNLLNEGRSIRTADASNTLFEHSFNYYKRLKKKGESFNLSHNLRTDPTYNEFINNYDLISYTSNIPSEQIRRLNDNDANIVSGNLNLVYRYPLSQKLTTDFTVGAKYGLNKTSQLTYDQNPASKEYDELLESQSYLLNRKEWTELIKLGASYRFNDDISLDIGLATEWLQIKNDFNNGSYLNQHYINLLPQARLEVGDLSINYNTSIKQPSIYNLQPVTIQTSQLYSFTGNPSLKPSRNHHVNLNFNKYFLKRQISIFGSSNFTAEENSIAVLKNISNEGASSSTPVNRNGTYNITLNGGINKTFKKSGDFYINLNAFAYLINYRNFISLNQSEGFQQITYMGISPSFSVNWKDKITLSPNYSFRPQITTYKGVDFASVKFNAHSFSTRYLIRWPKKIYWEGNYLYTYNPLMGDGFQKSVHLLNGSVSYQMFKKDRGELKLSCYDLLNQNNSSFRTTGPNLITDYQNQVLRRYFLLTCLIKFNKTSVK